MKLSILNIDNKYCKMCDTWTQRFLINQVDHFLLKKRCQRIVLTPNTKTVATTTITKVCLLKVLRWSLFLVTVEVVVQEVIWDRNFFVGVSIVKYFGIVQRVLFSDIECFWSNGCSPKGTESIRDVSEEKWMCWLRSDESFLTFCCIFEFGFDSFINDCLVTVCLSECMLNNEASEWSLCRFSKLLFLWSFWFLIIEVVSSCFRRKLRISFCWSVWSWANSSRLKQASKFLKI